MVEIAKTEIKDTSANPAPLGLLAFGMTTVLLNLHNAGYFELGGMILGISLLYGGLAQVIAGIMEWKKNNTFGTVAFTSYGFFWLSLVALVVLPKRVPESFQHRLGDGRLPHPLGNFHRRSLYRDAAVQPRPPIHLRHANDSLFPPRGLGS